MSQVMAGRCGRCGRSIRSDASITVGEVGARRYPCFNEEAARQISVEFDNSVLRPIVLVDHDGVPRTFEIRTMVVPTGLEMIAQELPPRTGGYRFAVLGDCEADALDLFKRLYQKMRVEMGVRHIGHTEHGWRPTEGGRLVGRIEWDEETGGRTPLLVVRGRSKQRVGILDLPLPDPLTLGNLSLARTTVAQRIDEREEFVDCTSGALRHRLRANVRDA